MINRISNYITSNKKMMLLSLIISTIICSLYYSKLGLKELLMIFIATNLLAYMVLLIKKDVKTTLLIFIASLPILVIGRKICYVDFLFLKVTYEDIYLTTLFFLKFKEIKNYYIENSKQIVSNFMIFIIIFLIFSLNSVIFSNNILNSLRHVYLGVITPIMFMVAIQVFLNKKDVRKVYYLLILSMNFSCLYGFLQISRGGIAFDAIKSNRILLTFGYHNVNIFAGILLLILPLVLDLILYSENSKKIKVFLFVSLFLQVLALGISFTRGAWLTFLICIFIMLSSKKYKRLLIIYIIAGLVVMKPLLTYIISRGTGTVTFLSNQSAAGRIQAIFTSFRIMFEYPFGIGMGNYQEVYKRFAIDGYMMIPRQLRWKMTAASFSLEHAHNLFLQIGVELGIITLIIFVLVLLNRLKLALKKYSINRGLFVSIIIYAIYAVVTGNELNHKGVISGTLILFMYFSLIQINNDLEFK